MLQCYVLTCGWLVTAFLVPPRSQRPGQGPRSPHPKAGPVCAICYKIKHNFIKPKMRMVIFSVAECHVIKTACLKFYLKLLVQVSVGQYKVYCKLSISEMILYFVRGHCRMKMWLWYSIFQFQLQLGDYKCKHLYGYYMSPFKISICYSLNLVEKQQAAIKELCFIRFYTSYIYAY
jgi:hypothetical protein